MHKNPFTPEESVLLRYLPEYARAISRWNNLRDHVSILAHNIQAAHVQWLGWECENYANQEECESDQEICNDILQENAIEDYCTLECFTGIKVCLMLNTKSTDPAFVKTEIKRDRAANLELEVDFKQLSESMGPGMQKIAAELVAAAHPDFASSPWKRLEDHDNLRINSHWGFKRPLLLHWDRVFDPIPVTPRAHPWCPGLLPSLREIKLAIAAVNKIRKNES